MTNIQKGIKEDFGITFSNTKILTEAFTQGNYLNEHPEEDGNDYQRLEFLGDSVMQLAVADYLFTRYPSWEEGQLTEMRIAMVQSKSFSHFARLAHFDRYIRLGKGEELSGARHRDSLLEDIWEAFVGALYKDQGMKAVYDFLNQTIFPAVDQGFFEEFIDYKSKLQELLQRDGSVDIEYQVEHEDLSDPQRPHFDVSVFVDGTVIGSGSGRSIKAAEKKAAKDAYQRYNGQ
ncbi:ribonuclease III [Oenococcus alcoholitolerans]|uniref:ribonuclease III n=1 Tax=Oenococcus alcoholitolerans TaxID=931074 RepID=UPI003F725CC5